MSGNLTLFGAQEILNSYFGQGSTSPTNFFLALIASIAPTPYMSGNELDEPVQASYVRATVVNDSNVWGVSATPNIVTLAEVISFDEAAEDWGILRYWALCNSVTGGNPVLCGKLDVPLNVVTGDTVEVPVGQLSVELGPFFAAWEL